MPAHLRAIRIPTCAQAGCGKKATKELRNTYNAIINEYCPKHAEPALRDFKRSEEKK